MGLGSLGKHFSMKLAGTDMHCTRLARRGKNKKTTEIRCTSMGPGAGQMSTAARAKAGVKSARRRKRRRGRKAKVTRRRAGKRRGMKRGRKRTARKRTARKRTRRRARKRSR